MEFYNRQGSPVIKPEEAKVEKRTSAYGIFAHDEKVVLVVNKLNTLEIPGGGKDEDETLLECLRREYLEETGHKVTSCDEEPYYTYTVNFYADDIDKYYESTMNFFVINSITKVHDGPRDKREIFDVLKLDIDKIQIEEIHFFHRVALEKFLQEL